MVERTGGAGGFGGATNDRTDQRAGRYTPHVGTVVEHDPGAGITRVKCVVCKAHWTHPWREPWGSAPAECARAAVEMG